MLTLSTIIHLAHVSTKTIKKEKVDAQKTAVSSVHTDGLHQLRRRTAQRASYQWPRSQSARRIRSTFHRPSSSYPDDKDECVAAAVVDVAPSGRIWDATKNDRPHQPVNSRSGWCADAGTSSTVNSFCRQMRERERGEGCRWTRENRKVNIYIDLLCVSRSFAIITWPRRLLMMVNWFYYGKREVQ